jgi:hypothetical protein
MKAAVLSGLMALVGFGLVLAKADLQDAAVCKWLAQRLIHRAAQRLPRGEQARWEEEWLRHGLDVPGRLPPIARAVSIFVRAGGWGRMLRDAPPRSQVLIARLRAAWVWLRSLPLSERPGPAVQARADVADAVGVAGAVYGVYRPGTNDHSIDVVVPRSGVYVLPSRQAGLPHLSDEEFVAWLAHQRQDVEDAADRTMAEYWRIRGQLPI